jgi:hypothetical protein
VRQWGKEMIKVSKASVDYKPATTHKRCGNCSMYRNGRCTLVEGNIKASYVCDDWEKKK